VSRHGGPAARGRGAAGGFGQGQSRDISPIVPHREQKSATGARQSPREWPGTPHLQHKDSGRGSRVAWGSSLELPVGGAGRGADGWAAGLGSGLSIPARATSTSSTTVHSKSSGWSMVWAELDDGGTCGQTGVVVSCAVGAVGEGGGPADVFPGLGGAHLVRSGGSGGRSRRTRAGLGSAVG
jgi:hypothetical protein